MSATMPPVRQDYYTEAEQEALRAQIRRANADARAEIERRGPRGPHPRVRRLMEEGRWPVAGGAAKDAAGGKP